MRHSIIPGSLGLLLVLIIGGPLTAQDSRPTSQPTSRPTPEPAAQLAIEKALRARLAQPITGALDVALITLGEDLNGAAPGSIRFSLDERFLIFDWKRWDEEKRGTWVFDIDEGSLRRLEEGEDAPLGEREVILSRDRKLALSSRDDRLSLIQLPSMTSRALMPLLGGFRAQDFALDGEAIVLRRGDDLWAWTIADGALRRLTRVEDEKREEKKNARRRYLEEAELRLLRHLFEKDARRKETEARREAERDLVSFAPPKGFRVSRLEASDDLARVLVLLSKSGGTTATKMPRYLADDGYVTTFDARPKVGDDAFESRVALLDATSGREIEIDIEAVLGKGPFSIRSAGFAPDSSRAVLLFRARDNKRAALVEVARDGGLRLLHDVEDEAWVRHVGDDRGFLADGRFWFTSERSGFNHLYLERTIAGEIEQLSSGDWLIDDLIVQRNDLGAGPVPAGSSESFLIQATRESPHRRDLFEIDQAGRVRKLLDGPWVSAVRSPRGRFLALLESTATRPPELRLVANPLDATPRWGTAGPPPVTLTDSPSPAFKSRDWIEPEFIEFEASDGVMVPARLYRPKDLEPGAPAVIFVHGAGYLQNVVRGWSRYYREYLFHNLLVERGYVVIDVDYRGSAGYGRDWRTAIYRHMGGRDLEDQVDAANWLVAEQGVDAERIGIYGGSYGGFITLMALFKHPGVFAAGAALRPVTDWAHYNHGYTSNILNTPQEDPEAFERSSPIWFAEGLRDRLLICHGLEDDNVQPQDSIRLVQRLIELRKTGWELALYPAEPHGFRDAASWADEYQRILDLFEGTIGKSR